MNRQDAALYALESLKKAGAQMASCRASSGRVEELNAEAGEFSLMRTLFTSSLTLTAIKDMKKGVAAINRLEKADIDEAVASCMASAEAGKPDEAEGIAEKAENKHFESGVMEPDKERLYDRLEEFMTELKSEFPKIILEQFYTKYNFNETVFLNTNGVEFTDKTGYYNFSSMFSARDGEKSSSFNGYGAMFDNLDRKFMDIGMTRRLFAESERQIDTCSTGSKFTGKVILTPSGLVDFLFTALYNFLSDAPMISGTSIWKNKLNEKVAHPMLNVRLAPFDKRIVCGEGFTRDGYESRDMDVISGGVLKSTLLSRYASVKTGLPRALNSSSNIIVLPGETELEQMIASIDRGLIVGRFSGGQPNQNGDFSGVAKNSFLIENGKISGAVSETMINGNLAGIFENIAAISKETVEDGYSSLPWMTVDGVTISGK